MRTIIPALFAGVLATSAVAGDVSIEVRNTSGQPVRDAVVMIRPTASVAPGTPLKVSWPMVMAQQNIQFTPYVLIAPLGSAVSFPNKDKVRHHVYSFSAPKKFELKLYGREESRTVTFDKPGAVSVGCNIHDTMIGYIYVSDTPFAAKSGPDGVAVVRGAPAGGATLLVWHPDLKTRTPFSRSLPVTSGTQRSPVTLDLRPAIAR